MITTVTLDESLVNELMSYFKAKTKTAAVAQAVKEQIRRAKLKRLANQLGSIAVDEEAITNGNNADRKREQLLNQVGVNGDSRE
jgi:hypothetical protein